MTPKTSFAEALRKRVKVTEEEVKKKQARKPDPVVVIKPKEGVQVEDARAEVQKKISAKNLFNVSPAAKMVQLSSS